jgi:hypothetical protein
VDCEHGLQLAGRDVNGRSDLRCHPERIRPERGCAGCDNEYFASKRDTGNAGVSGGGIGYRKWCVCRRISYTIRRAIVYQLRNRNDVAFEVWIRRCCDSEHWSCTCCANSNRDGHDGCRGAFCGSRSFVKLLQLLFCILSYIRALGKKQHLHRIFLYVNNFDFVYQALFYFFILRSS